MKCRNKAAVDSTWCKLLHGNRRSANALMNKQTHDYLNGVHGRWRKNDASDSVNRCPQFTNSKLQSCLQECNWNIFRIKEEQPEFPKTLYLSGLSAYWSASLSVFR